MSEELSKLYSKLFMSFMDILSEKEYDDITIKDITERANIDEEIFNKYFDNKADFYVKAMKEFYKQNGSRLDSIKDFNELCKTFTIAHLKMLSRQRLTLKKKEISPTDDKVSFYYLSLQEVKNFLKSKYETRKYEELKPEDEDLFIYRKATRIVSLFVYFYNNKNVTLEEMLPRVDASLNIPFTNECPF